MINSISSIQSISISVEMEGNTNRFQPKSTETNTAESPAVVLVLSEEAISALQESNPSSLESNEDESSEEEMATEEGQTSTNGKELTEEEKQVVQEMKTRDAEVRAHEQAHVAASGGLAGAPSYEYQSGPDGKRYAVGGHVHIDTSPGNTPEETVMKAEKIRSAALAPSDPSPQDRSVASQAMQMANEARMQIVAEKQKEAEEAAAEQSAKTEATDDSSSMETPDGIEQYQNAQRASEAAPTIRPSHSICLVKFI